MDEQAKWQSFALDPKLSAQWGCLLFQKLFSKKLWIFAQGLPFSSSLWRMPVNNSNINMWEWIRYGLVLFVQLDLGFYYELKCA